MRNIQPSALPLCTRNRTQHRLWVNKTYYPQWTGRYVTQQGPRINHISQLVLLVQTRRRTESTRLHQAPNFSHPPDTSDWTGRAGGYSDLKVNCEVFGSCWFRYRPPACRIHHNVLSFFFTWADCYRGFAFGCGRESSWYRRTESSLSREDSTGEERTHSRPPPVFKWWTRPMKGSAAVVPSGTEQRNGSFSLASPTQAHKDEHRRAEVQKPPQLAARFTLGRGNRPQRREE